MDKRPLKAAGPVGRGGLTSKDNLFLVPLGGMIPGRRNLAVKKAVGEIQKDGKKAKASVIQAVLGGKNVFEED